jgi:arginyl-tRNA synthetase
MLLDRREKSCNSGHSTNFTRSHSLNTLLSAQLTEQFQEAFQKCGLQPEFGKVVVSQRPELSNYQCNGALPLAKSIKGNPRQIAEKILDALENKELFSALSIDGPGFVNITLSDNFLIERARLLTKPNYAELVASSARPKTIIDFGGANVAKPMHVGHMRTALIGDCLQKLFRLLAVPIESDIHLGDWGTQMGMLICEIERKWPDLPYFDRTFEGTYPSQSPVNIDDLDQLYPQASARCKADKTEMEKALKATVELQNGCRGYRALWQHIMDVSLVALRRDFDELGVHFDQWFGESRYHDRIPALLKRLKDNGTAIVSDGALIVSLTDVAHGREIPPLILVKSDGGYLYGTTDMATLQERVDDFKVKQIIYVVDKRQSLHFEQLFLAAHKTGLAEKTITLEHIAYGTVNGTDGKPFKTRSGGAMKLKDLIEIAKEEALKRLSEMRAAEGYDEAERLEIANKVGIAALKFGELMHDSSVDYIFDISKFTRFEGRTGPYVLYSAVRIKSILKKAEEQGLTIGPISTITGHERELLLELCRFPDLLVHAYENRMPSYLCEFAFNLSQVFNRFYLHCHILNEQDKILQSSWLGVLSLCLDQMQSVLKLLGIDIPERM